MPCYSGQDSGGDDYQARRRLDFVEAVLCGVMKALDNAPGALDNFFNSIDWVEAGMTREQAVRWYMDHRQRDDIRRANKT